MKARTVALAILIGLVSPARADKTTMIGNWLVSVEEDRFGTGGSFVALTIGDRLVLAVRCIETELSIGLFNKDLDAQRLKPGAKFAVKFRTDEGPIDDRIGVAINERLIQVPTPTIAFIETMSKGKEMAVRVEDENGAVRVSVFSMSKASQAFSRLLKECGGK